MTAPCPFAHLSPRCRAIARCECDPPLKDWKRARYIRRWVARGLLPETLLEGLPPDGPTVEKIQDPPGADGKPGGQSVRTTYHPKERRSTTRETYVRRARKAAASPDAQPLPPLDRVGEARLALCCECPSYEPTNTSCVACGCDLQLKVRKATATCPRGVWEPFVPQLLAEVDAPVASASAPGDSAT